MKKVTCSKKLAWFSAICFAIAVIYGIAIYTYGTIHDKMIEYAMPMTLISVTGAVFGVTMVSYSNKSRYENVVKLQAGYLKVKYTLLKKMGVLDYSRAVQEIEDEFIDAEADFDNEKSMANQEITYNG
jgi:hypothetical protein